MARRDCRSITKTQSLGGKPGNVCCSQTVLSGAHIPTPGTARSVTNTSAARYRIHVLSSSQSCQSVLESVVVTAVSLHSTGKHVPGQVFGHRIPLDVGMLLQATLPFWWYAHA